MTASYADVLEVVHDDDRVTRLEGGVLYYPYDGGATIVDQDGAILAKYDDVLRVEAQKGAQ